MRSPTVHGCATLLSHRIQKTMLSSDGLDVRARFSRVAGSHSPPSSVSLTSSFTP